jgi:restriction endonuclease S subunit
MNGTIYMPVGEVCSSISDTYREKKNMVTLINTSDVLEGRVLNHERVPNSNLKGQFKKTFQRDDILYSEIRPQNRRFAYVDFSPIDYIASTKLMVIRAKKDVVSPKYLYYFLKNSSTVAELQLLAETRSGTFPQITFSEVANLTIPVPSLAVQEVIVQTMQCLEDKITCNEQINDNLQQQAFSVFDNLIANAENNDYTVSDYAFLNPKRTLAKNQVARSIDMSQLSTSGAFPSGWEMKPFNGGMRFTNGDTLLARITPCLENGKTAFIDFLDDGEVAFGSTEYIVLAPKNDTPPEMLYCLARYPAFVDYAVKNMNGSSGRQRVSAETVGQYRLPLFDKHSLVLFKEVVSPMFLKMRYNSLENMRLAELRDALLPKLMSGEIDVSAVQL